MLDFHLIWYTSVSYDVVGLCTVSVRLTYIWRTFYRFLGSNLCISIKSLWNIGFSLNLICQCILRCSRPVYSLSLIDLHLTYILSIFRSNQCISTIVLEHWIFTWFDMLVYLTMFSASLLSRFDLPTYDLHFFVTFYHLMIFRVFQ